MRLFCKGLKGVIKKHLNFPKFENTLKSDVKFLIYDIHQTNTKR